LIGTHYKDNGLGDDSERPLKRMEHFLAQRSVIFAFEAVLVGGSFLGFHAGFSTTENDGSVRFVQEEVANYGVEEADDCRGPEDPTPAGSLYNDTAKQRT
jgi:hypothetical protein